MINLAHNSPPLDLRYRIQKYKEENSPYLLTTEGVLCVSGLVCKNKPLLSYIADNTTSADLFDTPLIRLMVGLTKDISSIIDGGYISYTYQNRFVLFFKLDSEEESLYRDNVVSLVSSRIVNFLVDFYDNPMSLVSAYQVPKEEVKNILNYHKMTWVAKRNRILGSHYLGISPKDTTKTHSEILKLCQKKGFQMEDLSPTLQQGFAYSAHDF
jgi:hypothetical protein